MKESRDTETHPLTSAQIADDTRLTATLNTNYITVDTNIDKATYLARWVQAIRATGKHVWFRLAYGGDPAPGVAVMTPNQYLDGLRAFILQHASLFQSGDILDGDAEPENSAYWADHYGPHWSWQPPAPNEATDEFNSFLIALTDVTNQALQDAGISGVVTTVHSVDPWTATHPDVLYPSTVRYMGSLITVDAYPDADTDDPATAAANWTHLLDDIHHTYPGTDILIGEMGYSNDHPVSDATQAAVLDAELEALSTVPYLVGVNYWVGAGTDSSGGYTHIFAGTPGAWTLRPAANVLAAFYSAKTHGDRTPASCL